MNGSRRKNKKRSDLTNLTKKLTMKKTNMSIRQLKDILYLQSHHFHKFIHYS